MTETRESVGVRVGRWRQQTLRAPSAAENMCQNTIEKLNRSEGDVFGVVSARRAEVAARHAPGPSRQ